MHKSEAEQLKPGEGVVYRAYQGAEPEDGEVKEIRDSALIMVTWLNGPQAGKTTSVHYARIERAHPRV